MATWSYCAICGRAIPLGELCYGIKNWKGDPEGGETICKDCLVPENSPTLTQPNEGAKDKNVPTSGPLTLEELSLMIEPTPVWWDWVQGWVLARKGMIISWNGVYYNFGEVKGNFYRRPPEGEEET